MKIRPWGEDFMAGAFIACAQWSISVDAIRERFTKDTGLNFDFVGQQGINRMIDEACGTEAAVFNAYLDWVAENIWGTEDDEEPSPLSTEEPSV